MAPSFVCMLEFNTWIVRATTTFSLPLGTLEKMTEFRELVKGLNQTVCGERAHPVKLTILECVCIRLVITASLWESEGMLREAIYDEHHSFNVKASSNMRGPSAEGSSVQA